MFSKSKLFVAFLFSVSACGAAAVLGQDRPPAAPAPPSAPEAFTRVFTDGSGGYLGIESQEVTKENFSKFGLRDVRGVAVGRVIENSPAAQAGLQANDVIVRFNGEEVTSARKLSRLIGEVAPDHQARLTVLRGGSEREITATLGKRPMAVFGEGGFATTVPSVRVPMVEMPRVENFPYRGVIPSAPGGEGFYTFENSRQIGVGVSSLGKQLGEYFGVSDGKGLLVNSVRENSPAAKAGLKAGDVIVEVEGKAVAGSFDLTRAINEKKEGDVTLTIIRNKNRQTVRVTPEKGASSFGPGGAFELLRQENGGRRVLQPFRQYRRAVPPAAAPSERRILRPSTRTI